MEGDYVTMIQLNNYFLQLLNFKVFWKSSIIFNLHDCFDHYHSHHFFVSVMLNEKQYFGVTVRNIMNECSRK